MRPTTEADLAEAVAAASGPLRIRGGRTRGLAAKEGDDLHVTGLSGITLYEPGALTMVAAAGTPVADIETALRQENQRLAFEPMDHRHLLGTNGVPTIGGVVAGNVSGPRRIAVGACRDHLLGVRYVDGMGKVIKNGGRVMKNVTGYDLVKLMAGSWGTLGVLSEVSLKVLPVPERTTTLTLDGLDDAQAVAAMSAALGSPYEVTGATHANNKTHLRLEGFDASVAYRAEQLSATLKAFGPVATTEESDTLWSSIRDVSGFGGASGDVWKLSVKPSEAPELVARAEALDVLYDWGGGLVWLRMPEGTDLRERLGTIHGHATLVRASAITREKFGTFHPEAPAVAALSAGLRSKFDPRGIFNKGLMA